MCDRNSNSSNGWIPQRTHSVSSLNWIWGHKRHWNLLSLVLVFHLTHVWIASVARTCIILEAKLQWIAQEEREHESVQKLIQFDPKPQHLAYPVRAQTLTHKHPVSPQAPDIRVVQPLPVAHLIAFDRQSSHWRDAQSNIGPPAASIITIHH